MAFVTNIQWKGTDLCMDFNCPACSAYQHIDGMFVYEVECDCGAKWKMPSDIGPLLERVDQQQREER